jgi:Holliday junction resolvasome RuvABC endonuclease subunit
MKVLGIHIATGQCRFSVLEGSRDKPTLLTKGRINTPSHEDVPALMDWYDTQFRQLITSNRPDRIAYRLTLDPKKDQLICSEFPLGILNLIAYRESIPIASYTARSFAASRLGLGKTSDLAAHCDKVFGVNPPHWDINQKHSLLVAWFELIA